MSSPRLKLLDGADFMIVLAVVNCTYPRRRKEAKISLTDFSKLTLLHRPKISRAIKRLVRQGVLGSVVGDRMCASTYWVKGAYER